MAWQVTAKNLNLRLGPGTEYEILETLPQGTILESVPTSGWTPVLSPDGYLAWASTQYLKEVLQQVIPADLDIGEQILKLARKKIGQQYVYGAHADFTNEDYAGPWDCAEFVSWVVYMVTGRVIGCENNAAKLVNLSPWTGYWKRDADLGLVKHIGVTKAIDTPGAILLRYPNQRHIVFSDGQGGTVEAMGTGYGVRTGNAENRGFNYGIQV